MKRIILSLFAILVVGSAAAAATVAYFSDTETSTGNTFSAGTLDLKVGNQDDPLVVHVTKTNMKPQTPYSYQGYNNQWVLKNTGSLPGTASWTIKNLENYENGCIEPETGDTSCGVGSDQGELGQYTWVKWSRNGPTYEGFGPQFNPLNTANGVQVVGPVLQPGDTLNLYMWLDFPRRLDNLENITQSDSMQFNVEFRLDQVP